MKKVIVTGATGFLGKHVVKELEKRKYKVIPLTSKNCDMTDFNKLNKFIFQNRSDYIIHLAALCGGIGMNRKYPADFNVVNTMMGINLFEACKEYKKIFDESPKIVTLGSVCFTKNCLIKSGNRFHYINDLNENDILNSRFNKTKIVKTMERNYSGKLIHIRPFGGEKIEVTPEHPFLVLRNGEESWIEAGKLTLEDKLIIIKNIGTRKDHNIKFRGYKKSYKILNLPNKTMEIKNINLNQYISNFFGWYLAEGCCTKQGQINLYFGENELSEIERLREVSEKYFGRNLSMWELKNQKGYKTALYSKELSTFFKNNFYNCEKTTSHFKIIPDFIFESQKKYIKSFIRGYFDGDGHISKRQYKEGKKINCVQVSSASRELIYQLKSLILSNFNILGSIHKRPKHNNFIDGRKIVGNENWSLKFTGQNCKTFIEEIYPDKIENLKSNYRKSRFDVEYKDDKVFVPIISLESEEVENIKVYNFETEKNTYNSFDYIVHNCAYPKYTPVPFKEDYLWNGYPEETNAPYGLAKRMLLVQLNAYKEQYGLKGCYLLPANLYGQDDHFDLEDSHVIPALIRKFHEAKLDNKKEVLLWGSGGASREFLYVKDAARGIINAMEMYDGVLPINLGSNKEIKILDLAYLIKDKVGFKGKIVWDYNMPDGQPKRCLDTSRAKELFDFEAAWSFEDGIEETIKWYVENRNDILKGLK